MNATYGPSRPSPASLLAVATLPVLPPLPDPDAPSPRRRRTIVCSNLTVDGQTWGLDEAKAKMRDALRGDRADNRCEKRPGVHIAADYVLDICLSSWCRTCPFLPEDIVEPAPVAVVERAAPPTWDVNPLRERIAAALVERRIPRSDVAAAIGRRASLITDILVGRRSSRPALLEMAAYLGLTS